MHSSLPSIETRPQLNIVLAGDSILFAPFLMAYYANEFDSTPYGSLSVNMIGIEEDNRFKSLKVKGDGFATFCVIFGFADIAICDPSFFIFLNSCDDHFIDEQCNSFINNLTDYGRQGVKKRYSGIFNESNINIPLLRQLINKNYRIIGQLISKLPICVVSQKKTEKIKNITNYHGVELFGLSPLSDVEPQKFTAENIQEFIYYHHPTTGNCFGKIYSEIYKKNPVNSCHKHMGDELLHLAITEKPSYAFSSDYIAIDYRVNQEIDENEKICEIQDFAKSSENYMSVGFIGNIEDDAFLKIKPFLYCIDKNLYLINNLLENQEIGQLIKNIKYKIFKNATLLPEILKIVISDNFCQKHFSENSNCNVDTIIGYYANRLCEWHAHGSAAQMGLYYSTVSIKEDDFSGLINSFELRYRAHKTGKIPPELLKKINNLVYFDPIADWDVKEDKICHYKSAASTWKKNNLKPSLYILLLVLKSPLRIVSNKLRAELSGAIWYYLGQIEFLYWVGVTFILFEIITGLAHMLSVHIIPEMQKSFHINLGKVSTSNFELDMSYDFELNNLRYILMIYFSLILLSIVVPAYKLLQYKADEKFSYKYKKSSL